MRAGSVPGAIGILLVLTTTVLYLAIIDSQGDTGSRRTIGVVIALLLSAALGVVASWSLPAKSRSAIFAVAAGSLLGLGWLAIFSIGLLLLASGALFAFAALKVLAEAQAASVAPPLIAGAMSLVAAPALLLWIA
jgi:hypothetical protein